MSTQLSDWMGGQFSLSETVPCSELQKIESAVSHKGLSILLPWIVEEDIRRRCEFQK